MQCINESVSQWSNNIDRYRLHYKIGVKSYVSQNEAKLYYDWTTICLNLCQRLWTDLFGENMFYLMCDLRGFWLNSWKKISQIISSVLYIYKLWTQKNVRQYFRTKNNNKNVLTTSLVSDVHFGRLINNFLV